MNEFGLRLNINYTKECRKRAGYVGCTECTVFSEDVLSVDGDSFHPEAWLCRVSSTSYFRVLVDSCMLYLMIAGLHR